MNIVGVSESLEIILKRTRALTCEQLLSNREDKAISLLTIDLVMYFVEIDKLAGLPVKVFLGNFRRPPIVEADAQRAFAQFQGDDLEDDL